MNQYKRDSTLEKQALKVKNSQHTQHDFLTFNNH